MNIKEKLNKIIIQKDSNKQLLESRILRKEQLNKELENVLKSQILIQQIAQETQSLLSSKIDTIVNLGLMTCFPEYTFELQYIPARGKTEVNFTIKNGDSPVDILNQNGGGLVDLVCFCLRVAVFSISNTDNVIIFDEPFRFVSRSLRPKIAELLHTLSEQLKIQFIEVTHIDELSETSDKRIVIKKVGGYSNVC